MRFATLAASMALAALPVVTPAQAQYVHAGLLVCEVSGGVGMIVTSQRQLACRFTNSLGEPESYRGVITRVGLDLGATAGGQLAWAVFAPSGGNARGALAGGYGGASAEATVVATRVNWQSSKPSRATSSDSGCAAPTVNWAS